MAKTSSWYCQTDVAAAVASILEGKVLYAHDQYGCEVGQAITFAEGRLAAVVLELQNGQRFTLMVEGPK